MTECDNYTTEDDLDKLQKKVLSTERAFWLLQIGLTMVFFLKIFCCKGNKKLGRLVIVTWILIMITTAILLGQIIIFVVLNIMED